MKKSRFALFQSVIALLLCFSMLVGTTFAWFSDGVSSGTNLIATGNLNVELDYLVDGKWVPVDKDTEVLDKNALWEPGRTEVAYLRITNAGSLALKYALGVGILNETGSTNAAGEEFKLSEHIRFGLAESEKPITYSNSVEARGALANSVLISDGFSTTYTMNNNGDVRYVALVVYMPENIGNAANYATGQNPPQIKLGIQLVAAQADFESDHFGTGYDAAAELDAFDFPVTSIDESTSADVTTDGENKVVDGTVIEGQGNKSSAVIPAGVQVDNDIEELTLEVSSMASEANLELEQGEKLRSLNVHVEGVSKNNTVPMAIYIKEAAAKGLNSTSIKLYHVETDADGNKTTVQMTPVDGEPAHNQFKYDPATGDITLYLATFSEIAVVADTVNPWEGAFDYSWYDANETSLTIANADQLAAFGAIVGGMNDQAQDDFSDKMVTLIADVNLGNKIFYPIGYYNSEKTYNKTNTAITSSVSSFEGIFDGAGHTIANFYQNTWEMKGDDSYYAATEQNYNDAMGLFGYVLNGTIKNLTVDDFSSDGEYTPTGVIAAYAAGSAKFENIAITNCNPRVYNTGNGGIIGIAGDTSAANDDHITLKNITVDNSNKISALWGSYDVACGGLVGMYRGNVDGSGNATGDTISFENCHVSAQIDVYNDVCANYQYYAYRYAGMIIGSVRHNTKNAAGKTIPDMTGISAINCTANFGTWNDYYYCELVDNTTASYTHDHQMSRLTEIKAINGTTITYLDGTTGTVPASGRANYVIVNYSKGHGTENATCYHFEDGNVWNHENGGKETVNGVEVLKEDKQHLYLEFNNLFTGYGWGVSSMAINNWNGITALGVGEGKQEASVEKFKTKFTGDFLYRVGNANTVSLGTLFAPIDGVKINNSGVVVSIDNYEKGKEVSGTFVANTSDWTKGTIQFSGTGLVKVTIQDYDFCTPTELIVEVVDAYNATSAISAPYKYNDVNYNVVLLNNVENGSFTVSGNYGFYGNGFTIKLNPNSHSTRKGNGYAGYIHMNGGILDNVRIEGPVFEESNIYQTQGMPSGTTNSETTVNYFRNAINIDGGNAVISNSYISGARTAVCVKAGGNVVIENTRLSGGAYANIEVLSANSLKLSNVVTEQKTQKDSYDQNKNVIGTGIVINNAETKLILDGVTQYNWMTQAQWNGMLGSYIKAFPQLFNEDYTKLQFKNQGTTIVNTGIIWACDVAGEKPNVSNSISGYEFTRVDLGDNSGFVYTKTNGGTSSELEDDTIYAPDYESNAQDAVPPTVTFDYTSKNNEPEQTGSNDYCFYNADTDKFMISFDQGETKNWSYDILEIKKGTTTLDYSVSVTGTAELNSDKTITFKDAGDYVVEYTYTDTLNYKLNNGELVSYDKTYYQYIHVTVFVVEPEADPTTFAFGKNSVDGYKAVSAGGLTYVMPNVSGNRDPVKTSNVVTTSGIGSKTIDGQIIYYPIISQHKVGKSSSYYNYFSVFEAVTITDANGNKYSVYTTEMPSSLQVIGGFVDSGAESPNGTAIFNYSTGKTIKTKTVKDNNGNNFGLCYYPDSGFSSGTSARPEQTIVVKYCYTDSNGKAYYYYIGYHCAQGNTGRVDAESSGSTECITPDTLITLANGKQVRVDSLTGTEELLVWNLETGKYDTAPIVFVDSEEETEYEVIHLYFSDGSDVKVIYEHGFFDLDLGKYVYIDASNYADYVGHRFVTEGEIAANKWNIVTLDKVELETEVTTAWSPVTFEHLCYYTNGVLSMPGGIEGLFNIFDVDTDIMAYDKVKMQKDIETYGLFTIDDFGGMITEDAFNAFNGAYLKVAIGKGNLTWEDIAYMAERYIPLM